MEEVRKEYKTPVRTVICPKCLVFGATMDMRNSNKQVVYKSPILRPDGKAKKRWAILEHEIKCRACGTITRKVR